MSLHLSEFADLNIFGLWEEKGHVLLTDGPWEKREA